MRLLVPLSLAAVLLAAPATATAVTAAQLDDRALVDAARGRHGSDRLPTGRTVPGGTLKVSPAEALAGSPDVELALTLDRDAAPGEALVVSLPRKLTETAPSGLRYAGDPQLDRAPRGRGARLSRSGRALTLELGTARAGDTLVLSIPSENVDPGTYALALRWRTAAGTQDAGSVSFRRYSRSREEGEFLDPAEAGLERYPYRSLRAPTVETAAGANTNEESETSIVVAPLDSQRVFASGNNIGGAAGADAFISEDGGRTFTGMTVPTTGGLINVNGPNGPEQHNFCCDPSPVADHLGNVWFSSLTACGNDNSPSRIVVNRIAAGSTTFSPTWAGLPNLHQPPTGVASSCNEGSPFSSVIQDKNFMHIDNAPSSPNYGRLYMVWDDPDPGGAVNVVMSSCDTRVGGAPVPERCDLGANWSPATAVSGSPSGYITADIGTGPDGTIYVIWWNYSAANAIKMNRCDPSSAACTTSAAAWGTPGVLAALDATDDMDTGTTGNRFPFACPIKAQPGGRAAPVQSVDVDVSGGPNNGRIYVSWGDLRPGSAASTVTGTPRCSDSDRTGAAPLATYMTFDTFVASSTNYTDLISGVNTPSATRGTKIVNDTATTAPAAGNSDDFLSWVVVDQSTGDVSSVTYSTNGDDTLRNTTQVLRSPVTAPFTGTKPTVGAGVVQNAARSDYSDQQCCMFGNDYGDYTQIDAAEGTPYPVWTQRNPTSGNVDGDVQTRELTGPTPRLAVDSSTFVEGSSGDGDGIAERGESFLMTVTLRNRGDANQTVTTVTDTDAMVPGYAITNGASGVSSGTLTPNATALTTTGLTGTISPIAPCGAVDFRLVIDGTPGRTLQFARTVACTSSGANGPPVAALNATPDAVLVGEQVTVSAAGTTDPDNNITDYEFDLDGNGSYETNPAGVANSVQTTFASAGTKTVGVRVLDIGGASGTATDTVTVSTPGGGGGGGGGTTTTDTTPPPVLPPVVPPPGPGDKTGPTVVVQSGRSVRLTKTGFLAFTVGPFTEDVRGTLAYTSASKVAVKRGAKKKSLKLGTATFVVLKGKKLQVRRKLSKANLAAIRRLRKLKVKLLVTAFDSAGNPTARTITLTVLPPK